MLIRELSATIMGYLGSVLTLPELLGEARLKRIETLIEDKTATLIRFLHNSKRIDRIDKFAKSGLRTIGIILIPLGIVMLLVIVPAWLYGSMVCLYALFFGLIMGLSRLKIIDIAKYHPALQQGGYNLKRKLRIAAIEHEKEQKHAQNLRKYPFRNSLILFGLLVANGNFESFVFIPNAQFPSPFVFRLWWLLVAPLPMLIYLFVEYSPSVTLVAAAKFFAFLSEQERLRQIFLLIGFLFMTIACLLQVWVIAG